MKFTKRELDTLLKAAQILDDKGYEILGEQLHYVEENHRG